MSPLYLAILEATRQSSQCLTDETRWEVFVKVEGKASHRWWVRVVDEAYVGGEREGKRGRGAEGKILQELDIAPELLGRIRESLVNRHING